MLHSKVLCIVLLAAAATCEPPVQGYNYQPPRNNVHSYNAPTNNYLPPNTGIRAPSNNYLPPTSFSPSYSSTGSNYQSTGANRHSTGSNHHSAGSNYHSTGASFGGTGSSYSGTGSGYSGTGSGNSGTGSGYSGTGSGYSGTGSGFSGIGSGYAGAGHHDHHDHGNENEVPKSYEFGYSVKDAQSGNDYDRRETSDGNVVKGEYRVQLPDGRTQIVTYHADWQTGFHADVRYEGEARYPEPTNNNQQGGYNYNAPNDFRGSLNGFQGNNNAYKPSTAYGPPGYQ